MHEATPSVVADIFHWLLAKSWIRFLLKFAATRPLAQKMSGHQISFICELSLRHPAVDQMYAMMGKLVGNAMLHLVGLRIQSSRGRISELAAQIQRSWQDLGNCKGWAVLGQSLQSAMTETTKRSECTKSEKKKNEQNKRKRDEAKAKKDAEAAQKKHQLEDDGDYGLAGQEFFLSTHDEAEKLHVIRALKTRGNYANDAAFDSRLQMFNDQFATSQACISAGRAFMKLGDNACLLLQGRPLVVHTFSKGFSVSKMGP